MPTSRAAALQPPGPCEVCRQWSDGAVCSSCVDRFAPIRPRCRRCGLGTAVALPACVACLDDPPPFTSTVCVADYGFPWDGLITAFKFGGRVELAGALADRLAAAVLQSANALPALVVPVPLSSRRLAERGYNQAWEIARRCAPRLDLPAHADGLQRLQDGRHQAELNRRERQANLRHAFMVDPRQRGRISGKAVALVDDVMTTGSTLREAARALLHAGATTVQAWVIARTPEG